MTTQRPTIRRYTDKLALLIGHIVLRLALGFAAVLGLAALGNGMGMGTAGSTATQAPPATAPLAGDGFADHDLFNPGALLDTSRVDDLRHTPESECLRTEGVMTSAGTCVAGTAVWESEVDAGTWSALRAAGYTWSMDHSESDDDALWIPAEWLILGGEGGEDVMAVDLGRPLTAR